MDGLTSSQKGAIAEAEVAAAATRAGIVVLRPDTDGRRYDMVLDTRLELLRVQCKYAQCKGDVIVVHTRTSRLTPSGYRRTTYTRDEVDLIAVFCPDVEECFFIPIGAVEGRCVLHLRLAVARNNQRIGVTMADDYRLGAVAQLGERRAGSAKVRGSSPLSSTGPKAA
jgi:hypothetical protein